LLLIVRDSASRWSDCGLWLCCGASRAFVSCTRDPNRHRPFFSTANRHRGSQKIVALAPVVLLDLDKKYP
jgi:hypothetical protein